MWPYEGVKLHEGVKLRNSTARTLQADRNGVRVFYTLSKRQNPVPIPLPASKGPMSDITTALSVSARSIR
jgi:hypothetical protein